MAEKCRDVLTQPDSIENLHHPDFVSELRRAINEAPIVFHESHRSEHRNLANLGFELFNLAIQASYFQTRNPDPGIDTTNTTHPHSSVPKLSEELANPEPHKVWSKLAHTNKPSDPATINEEHPLCKAQETVLALIRAFAFARLLVPNLCQESVVDDSRPHGRASKLWEAGLKLCKRLLSLAEVETAQKLIECTGLWVSHNWEPQYELISSENAEHNRGLHESLRAEFHHLRMKLVSRLSGAFAT
jgi:hypothetical protein